MLEIFGEAANPGPAGHIDIEGPKEERVHWLAVLMGFLFSATILAGWFGFHWHVGNLQTPAGVGICVGGTLAYMFLGYFVNPKPNHSNLGWCGGLIDNPFRYSDDINRWLLTLKVILYPGRFLTQSLINPLSLWCQTNKRNAQRQSAQRQQDLTDALSRAFQLPPPPPGNS